MGVDVEGGGGDGCLKERKRATRLVWNRLLHEELLICGQENSRHGGLIGAGVRAMA